MATSRHMFPFFTLGPDVSSEFYSDWSSVAHVIFIFCCASFLILLLKNLGNALFREYIIAYTCGVIFGSGLMISGLCRISKVLNFLTVFANWDSTLLFILLSAMIINFFSFHFIMRGGPARIANEIRITTAVNSKLVLGSACFGLGWGLTGLAPGPALINMFILTHCIFYIAGMALGQLLYDHGVVTHFMKETTGTTEEKLLS